MRKTQITNMRKKKEQPIKKREKAQCGTLPRGAENAIRSKIEDELTEEKLRDRESTAHPNTPWAPSGLERIELVSVFFWSLNRGQYSEGGERGPGTEYK